MSPLYEGVTFSFSTEPEIITRARKATESLSQFESRDLVLAMLSNRKVFDAVCADDDDNYSNLHHAIGEVLDGTYLASDEATTAVADYDRIMKSKSDMETKIEKLEAELKELRANLHKA